MGDSDYSDDSEFDDIPVPFVGHGTAQDANTIINDAIAKIRFWKGKYHKCHKEKQHQDDHMAHLQTKLQELSEAKIELDKLRLSSNVEIRTLQAKVEDEKEQGLKFQGMLRQSKATLEDMVLKHRNLSETNRSNETKLYQIKIDLSTEQSERSRLGGELMKLQEEYSSLQAAYTDHENSVRNLASSNSTLKKEMFAYKDKCSTLNQQIEEVTDLCQQMDTKYTQLLKEHNDLKNESSKLNTSLTQAATETKEVNLKLTAERDNLVINYKHTKDSLKDLQERFDNLTLSYAAERKVGENTKLQLTQTEMSLGHVKQMFTEKEAQYKETISNLNLEVTNLKKELEVTKTDLRDSQANRGGSTAVSNNTHTQQIAALNTELGHLKATSEHLQEKIVQINNEKEELVSRNDKLNEEINAMVSAKAEVEIEMGKQRDVFKDEIRTLKNEIKTSENKSEVLQKKLEELRYQVSTYEHQFRALQTTIAEKTSVCEKLNENMSVLKTENNVINNSLNEAREFNREGLLKLENLKTRITVLQEDNKNLRSKADESIQKIKDKELEMREVQLRCDDVAMELHTEQVKAITEMQKLKEEYQDKIYNLQNELNQLKFEKDNKDEQIKVLKRNLMKNVAEKEDLVEYDSSAIQDGKDEYNIKCNEFNQRTSELNSTIQELRAAKVIADNEISQLKYVVETQQEQQKASETVIKETTQKLSDYQIKFNELQSTLNHNQNTVSRLEEIITLEKDKNARQSHELSEQNQIIAKLENENGSYRNEVDKLKNHVLREETERTNLTKELQEKDKMLSSEAKLRLHLSNQISTSNTLEKALEMERKNCEKLEDKIESYCYQIDSLRDQINARDSDRKKIQLELEDEREKRNSGPMYEEKIKTLKSKLLAEKENAKKVQDDLAKRLKKAQLTLKQEVAQRKELNEKYLNMKTEVGELQGKLTVLIAENQRLKTTTVKAEEESRALLQTYNDLENKLRNDYMPKAETEMIKKNLEARNRIDLNRKVYEINKKIESDNKSREAIEKFKLNTENQIRTGLESTNKQLKLQIEDINETLLKRETNIADLTHENNRLKQILAEERQSSERLMPIMNQSDIPILPIGLSPRSPHKLSPGAGGESTWMLMKSKLNESLNRYVTLDTSPNLNSPSILHSAPITPGRVSPGNLSPGRTGSFSPTTLTPRDPGAPVRTSAESFF